MINDYSTRWVSWAVPIFLGLLAALLAVFPVSSYDVWWILAAGERMLESGTIPRTGAGSWTHGTDAYVYHGWGFCVIAAWCYRMAGEWGIILLRVILACLCFFLLSLAIFVRGVRGGVALLLPGLALLFGFTNLFWAERPQSASQVLLAALLLILARDSQRSGTQILWTVPVFFLWANLHGGVLLGIAMLSLGVVGNALDGLIRKVDLNLLWRITALGLSVLVCFMTPYGSAVFRSAIYHVSGGVPGNAFIMEWAAPNLLDHPLFILILILASSGLILSIVKKHLNWADILLFALFAVMGLRVFRYMEISALGLSYVGACSWWAVTNQYFSSPRIYWVNIWGSLLTLVFLLTIGVGRDEFLFQGGWRPKRPLPVAAVNYLSSHNITEHLINPYEWGGYLIWKMRPLDVAFIDGRADLYSDAFVKDYLTIDAGAQGWKDAVDRNSIQAILWRAIPDGVPLQIALADEGSFVPVYADKTAVVYVRKNGIYDSLIKEELTNKK